MNSLEHTTSPNDNSSPNEERKKSPPAFLDLADSAARLGTNLPDMSARVELKRLEHERQRALQRKFFEDQMKVLEHQQAQELLTIPYESGLVGGGQHIALSAPTTPPGASKKLADLRGTIGSQSRMDPDSISKAFGSSSDKRKSVTYAPSVNLSPDLATNAGSNGHPYARSAGAKSMPASRRTSASEHDEELAAHLQGLSLLGDRSNRASPIPSTVTSSILLRGGRMADEGARYASTYNAGLMLDEQLDQEMHNAMRNLPTSDEDKFHAYASKLSTSAALDLAHASQTSPRTQFANRGLEGREQSSEWPQFTGGIPRGPDGLAGRADRRNVTNPNIALGADEALVSGILSSNSALVQQLSQGAPQQTGPQSRRGSPHSLLESLTANTRSVPATPLNMSNGAPHLLKTSPGTPLTPDIQLNGRIGTPNSQHLVDAGSDLSASLSRIPSAGHDASPMSFNSIQSGGLDDYGLEATYAINAVDGGAYGAYGYEGPRGSISASPNVHVGPGVGGNGYPASRYGLGLGRGGPGPLDGKMNGLHGPKHKRGDIDREFNRFAGTRLEELQGEIATLCKDQHGCRYLQKKLEEGVPEHRDMIFRETFKHFAELMTDPFGNYLCQKLLEFATDDQRNLICESVAQDLVNISLNMHGTRAVQKMIDFLSTRRQIHSIILALSLHVVSLIKDLNGNHVIQKCLNKLAPEDNQFIYNAVAANCVEVATHRHGCCVLQRCIDHASEAQRIQLVNEITYNALTLVQDPYGNYVVQYILDLNDNRFSDGVIRQFLGNICALSVQKFSSNVMEKCIRVAEHNTRKLVIEELLNRTRLEKLLRDSYGNYCVQTALDYAEPGQRALLVEGIRPVLPLIRNTPYGKRIQNKLQRITNGHGGNRHHMSNGGLHDVYNSQALYGMPQPQASFGQNPLASPLPPLHPLQQPIDGYVLQNANNPALAGAHPAPFAGASFANVNPFAGAMGAGMNDHYQRAGFAYGM
ncbi:pumilio-family RNA binding protein [Coprinopsis cinerea okayama7|uniref:Pumilio-family RNA binding protein n=1 Tax=Coprinopsis cinerea (strain Okayama-7 / 130 / ATCC MYA-4618 / FGSC 9003) TaxID=240176 RepID=A8N273_COPC7|nr:pumilio-family RNA binding protein [Coprinopsis cinerea okayama7\|eukprot:XP_001828946.2 pumilio-family RNA binding protein [Coprinopsis cinerea okayama7\